MVPQETSVANLCMDRCSICKRFCRARGIGIVIYDPDSFRWYHSAATIGDEWTGKFAVRQQYIGQLECLAAVAAYSSLPSLLKDRDVIHFILPI